MNLNDSAEYLLVDGRIVVLVHCFSKSITFFRCIFHISYLHSFSMLIFVAALLCITKWFLSLSRLSSMASVCCFFLVFVVFVRDESVPEWWHCAAVATNRTSWAKESWLNLRQHDKPTATHNKNHTLNIYTCYAIAMRTIRTQASNHDGMELESVRASEREKRTI